MKRTVSIVLCLCMLLPVLSGCEMNVTLKEGVPMKGQTGQTNNGGNSNAPSGNNSTPPGGTNNETGNNRTEDVIVTFNFEDEEHRQAVLAWLKTVLPAENYYEFIDGEDYNAPFDFDDESPAWHEEAEAGEEE